MNEKMPNNDIDWKLLLMRVLECWGSIHNDLYEECWHKFGITKEEGRAIVREYEEYEQKRAK